MKKLLSLLLALFLLFGTAFAAPQSNAALTDWILVEDGIAMSDELLIEYGYDYSTPEEVALYLYAFGELPPNFLTKDEARDLGWVSNKGNLWDVAYGLSIGGDVFQNREGALPKAKGRTWYECDVNYYGGFRGGERIVFATDGLIYYTDDHYETFELLYEYWYDPDYRYGEDDEEGWTWSF